MTKKIGFYTEIGSIFIHTDFDISRDGNWLKAFELEGGQVPGVQELTTNRYSIVVNVGFLFDTDKVRTDFLPVVERYFEPDEVTKIPLSLLVDRAMEQQMRVKEELSEPSDLLLALMAAKGTSEA